MKHLHSIFLMLLIGFVATFIVASDSSPPEIETPNKELFVEAPQSQVGAIFQDVVLDDKVLNQFMSNKLQVTPIFAVAPEVASVDLSTDLTKQAIQANPLVIYDKFDNPTLGWEVLYKNISKAPVTYDLILQDKIPKLLYEI